MNEFLEQLKAQFAAGLQQAYDKGLADGKAQSPDLAAAIAADHASLGATVSVILEKDEAEVVASLEKLKGELAATLAPPTA